MREPISKEERKRMLGKVLHKHYKLLQSNRRLQKAFLELPMVAFKRLKSIRDILVHTGARPTQSGVKGCSDKRCKCCRHLQEKTEFDIRFILCTLLTR